MRMEGIQGMLNQETAGWIVGMCALVLLIGLGGRYMRRLAAVALRAVAGTAGIYCLDLLFTALGIGLHAGSICSICWWSESLVCRGLGFVRGSGDQNIVKNR